MEPSRFQSTLVGKGKTCQEKTLDGTKGRTLGQSVASPLSGAKPPGSGRAFSRMTHHQHFSVRSVRPASLARKQSICFDNVAETKWCQVGLMEKAPAYCFHERFRKPL